MTLVDHWDVEDLKFRILSGSVLQDRLLPENKPIVTMDDWEFWKNLPQDILTKQEIKDYCWIWQGNTSGKGNGAGRGYGRIKYRGESRAVHRLSFVCWNGPIRGSKVVDHICTNRLCCNPNHLQLVTQKQNVRLIHKRKKAFCCE